MSKLLETPSRIEPCLLGQIPVEIADLIGAITAKSKWLEARLPAQTAAGLADYVRIINCYYSNLIEGHNTVPRDIERALKDDEKLNDVENKRRDLLIEACAHVRVQEEIDRLFTSGKLPPPASTEFLCWAHRKFYEGATEDMLTIKSDNHSFLIKPGELRSDPKHDVSVGRHIPPSSAVVNDFMSYFEKRYDLTKIGQAQQLIAMAAAHHRLNYIHPFPDGNGRVSRLMSHAMGLSSGIGAHALWSISRGLARGLQDRGEYKRMMDRADTPRQGDLDGRGNLSLQALTEFVGWYLQICLDQIIFMGGLFDLDSLADRLGVYARSRDWPKESHYLLLEALRRGEMARGEAPRVTGLAERTARKILSDIITDGILTSNSPKGPVHLRITADSATILFPRLAPETQ